MRDTRWLFNKYLLKKYPYVLDRQVFILENSSGLFPDIVSDFIIIDQMSFQIFYEESQTSAWVLVNSREGGEREEGGAAGRREERKRRNNITILRTFFWRKFAFWQGDIWKKKKRTASGNSLRIHYTTASLPCYFSILNCSP